MYLIEVVLASIWHVYGQAIMVDQLGFAALNVTYLIYYGVVQLADDALRRRKSRKQFVSNCFLYLLYMQFIDDEHS